MDEKIMAVLAETVGADPSELEPDIALFDEELLDSFGVISLLVGIEEKLGITIEPTEITRDDIATPAKLIECVKARAAK